ncbi:helix-turn-helix domain-containing protein [Paracoccus sp. CPCC 101403]|uniref:Helix-turn-helix domain-containing protein n=2 Tax=Paracoccus broussonetiae TaxID=3075834 RepID=A0ABU3E9Q2_9RHOB|nr:helix-turn-helix domain-containing protein [Paracoccus sp. CPCC 101403]MDT1060957.1 helix-turn-helix domain-containing protein [Paracoccus sp. CPCC 101403]
MLSIGNLSKATGVKVPTIRYYEQIDLLPEAARSAGNQRLYGPKTLERLAFIRHARDLGFPLEEIRELLSLSDDPSQPCQAVDQIAVRQLAAVNARIERLAALRTELERMLHQCRCGTVADCRVIEVLGNHELCGHDHGTAADQL